MLFFTGRDANFHLGFATLPIERNRHNGFAFPVNKAGQPVQFAAVQQQLSRARRARFDMRTDGWQRIDTAANELRLAIAHEHVAVRELHTPLTERFHLPAFQRDTGLEPVFDLVIEARALVQGDGFLSFFAHSFLFYRVACGSFRITAYRIASVAAGSPGTSLAVNFLRAILRGDFSDRLPAMDIARSALVPHSALDMYRLVHDVSAYPDFLSWCSGAELHEQTPELQVASLDILVGGVSSRFTTRNRLERGERLVMALVDGPFRQLSGEWRFEPLGQDGSKIALELAFEVSSRFMKGAFSQGFSRVADRLVKDFSQRADAVYGG